jgi:hypothetical protein
MVAQQKQKGNHASGGRMLSKRTTDESTGRDDDLLQKRPAVVGVGARGRPMTTTK